METKKTYTEDDKAMFFAAWGLIPFIFYVVLVPAPWSDIPTPTFSTDIMSLEGQFYFFTIIYALVILFAVKRWRNEFGDAVEVKPTEVSKPHTRKAKEHVSQARIVRKDGQMTIYDESNRVVYKKL